MILSTTGELFGVGRNNYYQIGAPETETYKYPQLVNSLKEINIVDVACGDEHTVCVSSEGKVYGFGKNSHYQLGNTKGLSQQPHKIVSLDNFKIKKVECGSRFTIVLTDDGKLYGFGHNSNYEIAYSEPTQQHFPRLIQQLRDVSIKSFSCGSSHTMVIDSNGVLYGFGSNESGQLGLVDQKDKSEPTVINSLRHVRISKVVCGSYFTMALSESGIVYAFGQNSNGQLGLKTNESVITPTPVPLDVDIVDMACGFSHAIFLSDEGKVLRTGQGALNQGNSAVPEEIMKFRNVRINRVISGLNHCIAYYSDSGSNIMPISSILQDIESSFDNPEFSDVAFIVEGKPIYVNKFILSVRCEKFRIQFNSGMSDSTSKEIIVKDVKYDHYRTFLKYLYTDKPEVKLEDCVDVLNLATEHDVQRLVKICEKMIRKSIDIENVSRLYEVASLYNTSNLKKFCLNFIHQPENFFKVIKTDSFESLKKESIIEILQSYPEPSPMI